MLLAVGAYAQGNGIAGITEATNIVTSYFNPGTKLIYAVGAVVTRPALSAHITFNNEAKEEEDTTEGNTITPIGTSSLQSTSILNQRWQSLACRVSAACASLKRRR